MINSDNKSVCIPGCNPASIPVKENNDTNFLNFPDALNWIKLSMFFLFNWYLRLAMFLCLLVTYFHFNKRTKQSSQLMYQLQTYVPSQLTCCWLNHVFSCFFLVEVRNFNVLILSHFSWLSYNNLQDQITFFHRFPDGFPTFSCLNHNFHQFSSIFYGFLSVSIVFPWYSHSFPMVFPWFCILQELGRLLDRCGLIGRTLGRNPPCSHFLAWCSHVFGWCSHVFGGFSHFLGWCSIDFPIQNIQISNSLAVSMHFSIVRFSMDTPLYCLNSVTICFVFFRRLFRFFCCFCLTDIKGIWLV